MMKIEMMKIADLRFAEYNPRQISESQFAKLRESIRKFGFVDPVIVNRHADRMNIIVGGHMRVRAAKLEGYVEVPCVFVELDEQKEKALNLALNRISGEWDEDKLAEIVHSLDEETVRLTGFEDKEITALLDDGTLKTPPESKAGDGLRPKFTVSFKSIEDFYRFKNDIEPLLKEIDGVKYTFSS